LVARGEVGLDRGVGPQRECHVLRVRHRQDVRRVHGGELVDQAEDRGELRAHLFGMRGVDLHAREVRDPVNVSERDGHGGGRASGWGASRPGRRRRIADERAVTSGPAAGPKTPELPRKISAGAMHNRLS